MVDCSAPIGTLTPGEAARCATQGVGKGMDSLSQLTIAVWGDRIGSFAEGAGIFVIYFGVIASIFILVHFFGRLLGWYRHSEVLEFTDQTPRRKNRWGAFLMLCGFGCVAYVKNEPWIAFLSLWLCLFSLVVFFVPAYWWGRRSLRFS